MVWGSSPMSAVCVECACSVGAVLGPPTHQRCVVRLISVSVYVPCDGVPPQPYAQSCLVYTPGPPVTVTSVRAKRDGREDGWMKINPQSPKIL